MKKIFKLEGLGCAHCATKMEENIAKIEGVKNVTINFMTTKLTLEADENLFENIIEDTKKIINNIEPDVKMIKA